MDKQGNPSSKYYANTAVRNFETHVAEGMYLRNDYKDSIWSKIWKSPLAQRKKYVYSDLGLMISARMLEKISGSSLEQYVQEKFYRPLGIHTLGFNPLKRFRPERIVPTEKDAVFRQQEILGYVNDPAAAMLGGIAGHAGLFGTSNDLAILMQMLVNQGTYGGEPLLSVSTIKEFTRQQFPGNRRGMIFDRPEIQSASASPAAQSAPSSAFGHTGFTGTCVWADPEQKFVYVFLSNRTYPDAENKKLSAMNVRTDIHQLFYDVIKKTNCDREDASSIKSAFYRK
jgi:CubicO group peptidase (beta-lactamase class C family)